MRVYNGFEGGTDGVSISTGNSGVLSGIPFDQILTAANTLYSAAHPAHGRMGMHSILGGAVTNAQAVWIGTVGAQATYFGRLYLDGLSNYTPGEPVLALFNAFQAAVSKWRVALDATGHVISRRGSTTETTSSTIIQLGRRYRIEFLMVCSLTVQQSTIWIYDSGGNLLETNVSGTWAGEANHDEYRFGLGGPTAPTVDAYFDDLALDTLVKIGADAVPVLGSRWTGALKPDGAKVAVHVADTSQARLKVSLTSDLLTNPVFSLPEAPDGNGRAKCSISGLAPNTQYWYGVEVDGAVDLTKLGKFKTLPTPGAPASFSFAAASCGNNNSNHAVFDSIRQRTGPYGGPLFFQHLGDLHYQNIGTNDPAAYRAAYYNIMTLSRQAQLYAEVPTAYIWSDHDSGAADHDGTDPGLLAAQPVYRQVVPHYLLPDPAGIYYSFVVGRVLFICTDGFSFRGDSSAPENSAKTMLGAAQKQWLKARLLEPQPVKVWCAETAWIGAPGSGTPEWRSFSTERQEIADFIVANGVKVLYVGGDVHTLAADNGVNSVGSIPVVQCAPLDQTTFLVGTYSQGFYPDPTGPQGNQYGWFDVTDNGSSITVAFTGYDSAGVARITMTTVLTAGQTSFFRPPSFQLPHDESGQDRLWSRVSYPRGRTVLNPEPSTGQVTPYPGREEVASDLVKQVEQTGGKAYLGGGIYQLTPGEVAVLTTAGYAAHISGAGP